jgi:CBS domain-containing protein
MRVHQIMTKNVISINEDTSIVDAARLMLQHQISGLPVVEDGKLTGILSESDFIRRAEIGTQRKRARWLQFLVGPGRAATEFVEEHGRKASEVMTRDPHTVNEDTSLSDAVELMERKSIKRFPVVRDKKLVGIVTRSNLLQAVAALARNIPDPTADDDNIRRRILDTIEKRDWSPFGLGVTVKDGVVDLHGIVTDDRFRKAAVVAAENVPGVKIVHDHLRWVEPLSGMTVGSPEDEKLAEAS